MSVVGDQKMSSGVSTGQVGQWEGGPNFVLYGAPHTFTFNRGTPEKLLAAQGVISNEKYNAWKIDQAPETDVTNHHLFPLSLRVSNLTATFLPTYGTTLFTVNLLDAPGSSIGTILFQDPWLIDFNDSPYGMRNQGIGASFKSRTTPFAPELTTSFGSDVYKGVFLNQIVVTGSAYYSVRAPLNQNIQSYPIVFISKNLNKYAGVPKGDQPRRQ